jgi:hypothetical protein
VNAAAIPPNRKYFSLGGFDVALVERQRIGEAAVQRDEDHQDVLSADEASCQWLQLCDIFTDER